MNKTIDSKANINMQLEKPLNAKYYPLNDEALNGKQMDPVKPSRLHENPIIDFTLKVLVSLGLDLD